MKFMANGFQIFVLELALSFAYQDIHADSATLKASSDTSLFETNPDFNLGSADLAAGTTARNQRSRVLIRFDFIGVIPSNATITSVQFTIRESKSPPGGIPSTFDLHRVLQSWGEGDKAGVIGDSATTGEATWKARSFPATLWSSPGASAPGDFVAKASASRLISGLATYTFNSTTDLVADVQAWVANPDSNFGWIMISQSEGTAETARRFVSSEASANGPTLVVQYTPPAQVTAPVITAQPQNQTVAAGASAAFGVTATGTAPLAYQWKFNSADIPGASTSTLSLSNVLSANAGNYTVVVSNSAGSVASDAGALVVLTAPNISQQPQSQTVNIGATVTFAVTATGDAPLNYQWKFNSTDIPGATRPTFTLNNVRFADDGSYTVLISNSAGSVTSSTAILSVWPSLSVNDITVIEGNFGAINAIFTVSLSASYNQTVAVNFFTMNGTATSGADYLFTSGTLSFNPGATNKSISVPIMGDTLNESDEIFFLSLANPTNATLSKSQGKGTIFNDDPAPTISISDVSVTEGDSGTRNAVFAVSLSAASDKAISVGFVTINETAAIGSDYAPASGTLLFNPGETNKTILVQIIGDIAVEPDESFFVRLSNPTNASISLGQGRGTILNDDLTLSITSQPQSQTVTLGGTASFTVATVGGGTLVYQWKFNGVDITRATNSTFTLSNVQPSNAGNYSVVVTNPGGSIRSSDAILTVIKPVVSPTIAQQPQSQTVNVGDAVTFTVVAAGDTPLSYQWKFNSTDIPGATGPNLTIASAQTSNSGSYSVTINNAGGSVTSDAALLTVQLLSAPTLSVEFLATDKIKVSWPASASGFILETNISLTATGWSAVPSGQVLAEGASLTFTESVSGSTKFYRLKKN